MPYLPTLKRHLSDGFHYPETAIRINTTQSAADAPVKPVTVLKTLELDHPLITKQASRQEEPAEVSDNDGQSDSDSSCRDQLHSNRRHLQVSIPLEQNATSDKRPTS
jgi:hypothetical protein